MLVFPGSSLTSSPKQRKQDKETQLWPLIELGDVYKTQITIYEDRNEVQGSWITQREGSANFQGAHQWEVSHTEFKRAQKLDS